ncbi:MAG: lamin tail domain-containing protein [Candidatus Pacebacteria bacterium]|nr:lamin tail domain-containing protein [Candidatus Paceibacterota bacterium]
MEIRKYVIFILTLTGIILIPVFSIEAYNNITTHPALTKETIELFNYQYPDLKLADEEKEKLMLGSLEEDVPESRCLNHFYDPIYKDALSFGIITLSLNAKEWSQDTIMQMGAVNVAGIGITKDLFSAKPDYSWERAIFDYVHNDKERALEALGHVLHLIQDMSVPAHVRNDDHPIWDPSPYEDYTSNFTKDNIRDISLILEEEKEILFDNVDTYFDSMAGFTNKNFFSKDTVNNEIRFRRYTEPVVDFERIDKQTGVIFGYRKIKDENFKLVKIDYLYNKLGKIEEVIYKIKDKNKLILQDYWQILSKQAVLHGAGVIKLFFDEVEKEKESLALLNKNTSAFRKLTINIKDGFSKLTGFFSTAFANINRSIAKINRKDLLANMDVGAEGFAEQNPPNKEPKPEDPGSPELQRLALILREAEKMIGRTERGIDNFEGQNPELVLIPKKPEKKPPFDKKEPEKSPEKNKKNNKNDIDYNPGFGGGGGSGGAATQTTQAISTAISSPQITDPIDFSQTFTSTTIEFLGTASSTQTISTDFSSATTTVLNNNTWKLTLNNFNQGTTTLSFFASDNQGNISQANTKTLFIDTFTPDVSLDVSQCDNSISNNSCLVATTTLDILWSTTASGSDFAYFNIKNNGVFSTTTATSTQVTNLNEEDYEFSVASVAKNGNTSATSTQIVKINQMPVVINEIAWAGTDASVYDEWIELYNRSDEDINLEDWILYSQDGSPDLYFANAIDKIIEAKSYYLIERTDDTTISNIKADFVINFGTGLGNGGEHLILAYKKPNQATTTIDQAPFAGNWIYKDGNRSLERYDYNSSGNNTDNWDLSAILIPLFKGEDANGNRINGTPKARNSINYKIAKNGVLDSDKIITKDNSPYIVMSDGLTVQLGKTLVVEEGVVIKTINRSGSAEIKVNGTVKTNGSVTKPVIFTTFGDDIGGDTNGDGVCISGTATSTCPGELNNFWSQLILTAGSIGSEFNNTIFKYGGHRLYTTYPTAMLIVDKATANFNNSTFENSYSSGLYADTSILNIDSCIFQNNKSYVAYNDYSQTFNNAYYGLVALRGDISVENSDFNYNQIGLGLFDTQGSIVKSNTFKNNNSNEKSFPLILNGSFSFEVANNSGSGNDKNGIQACGYITKVGFNTILTQNPLPYVVEKSIEIMKDTSLSIEAGSVFKFKNSSVNIMGELNINGVLGNPVIFTSAEDDSDGVDVYNDGLVASSTITKKGGINLHSATSTIKNAEFRYLDRATAYYNTYGVQSPLNLENIIYSYNTWSIFADEQTAPVDKNDNVQFIGAQSMSSLDNW